MSTNHVVETGSLFDNSWASWCLTDGLVKWYNCLWKYVNVEKYIKKWGTSGLWLIFDSRR